MLVRVVSLSRWAYQHVDRLLRVADGVLNRGRRAFLIRTLDPEQRRVPRARLDLPRAFRVDTARLLAKPDVAAVARALRRTTRDSVASRSPRRRLDPSCARKAHPRCLPYCERWPHRVFIREYGDNGQGTTAPFKNQVPPVDFVVWLSAVPRPSPEFAVLLRSGRGSATSGVVGR